jgi:hypothetical protein
LLYEQVWKFPAIAAVAAGEKGVSVVVGLNVRDQLRKFVVVQCCPEF